jgi:hypothetical protein
MIEMADGVSSGLPRRKPCPVGLLDPEALSLWPTDNSMILILAIRGRALCNRNLRTPPDPEGSNGKEALLCAAGSPGPPLKMLQAIVLCNP